MPSSPSLAFISASSSSESSWLVTTATPAWFLAAARIMLGPPMSMFSITTSSSTPRRPATSSKGYRLQTTMSMGSMSCAAMVLMCSGTSRRARMPAMSLGCMVLTRPSSISGKPVTSSTSVTGIPESLSSLAVPPVEMTWTPMSVSPFANDSKPLLLNTEIRARWTFTGTLLRMDYPRGDGRRHARAPLGASLQERQHLVKRPGRLQGASGSPALRRAGEGFRGRGLLVGDAGESRAADDVVVHDPGGLHQGVGGGRPDEAEAALLEVLGQRGRLRDRGLDLEPVADDAGICEQARRVGFVEGGHGGDVEARERRPEGRPLAQYREPRQARLQRLEGEALEQPVVVEHRPAPLVVVVRDVFGSAADRPETARATVRAVSGIVRNRLKIEAATANARAAL